MPDVTRREVLRTATAALCVPFVPARLVSTGQQEPLPPFRISLAQWSLHRTIRAGKLDHLDFARVTRQDFGLDAIE